MLRKTNVALVVIFLGVLFAGILVLVGGGEGVDPGQGDSAQSGLSSERRQGSGEEKSSSEASATGKNERNSLNEDCACIDVSIKGIPAGEYAEISCWSEGPKRKRLWQENVSVGTPVTKKMPSGVKTTLFVHEGKSTSPQKKTVTLSKGGRQAVVFDYSNAPVCTFEVSCPGQAAAIKGSSAVVSYYDMSGQVPVNRNLVVKVDDQCKIALSSLQGKLVKVKLLCGGGYVGLRDIVDGSDNFIVAGVTYVVEPQRGLVSIRAIKGGKWLNRFSIMSNKVECSTRSGVLLIPRAYLAADVVVFGEKNGYAKLNKRDSEKDCIEVELVDVNPVLSLRVKGVPPQGCKLYLYGPKPKRARIDVFEPNKPVTCEFRDGEVSLSGLLPGRYYLKWKLGRTSSPKIKEFELTIHGKRVVVDSPSIVPAIVEVWDFLAENFGVKKFSFSIGQIAFRVDSRKVINVIPPCCESSVMKIHHPVASFFNYGASIDKDGSGALSISVKESLAVVRLRLLPAFSGELTVQSRVNPYYLKPVESNEFSLVGVVGRPLRAIVWERRGGALIYRGSINMIVEGGQGTSVGELPGRWFDVFSIGSNAVVTISVPVGRGETIEIGGFSLGTPYRLWLPLQVSKLYVSVNGKGRKVYSIKPGDFSLNLDS